MACSRSASNARMAARSAAACCSTGLRPTPVPFHAPRRRLLSTTSTRSASSSPQGNPSPVRGQAQLGHPRPNLALPDLARENPAEYYLRRPVADAALAALAARVGLIGPGDDEGTRRRRLRLLRSAATHPSYWRGPGAAASGEEQLPVTEDDDRSDNAALATLGNSLLGLFATEHLHIKYPHLPTRVLKAAVSAFVGPLTCADVAREVGGQAVLRWRREAAGETLDLGGSKKGKQARFQDAMASVIRAILGAVHQEKGLGASRRFAHSFFLSRTVDLPPLIKFANPKHVLSTTVKKYNKPDVVSRLLKETGRLSISPVFVVGVFSGRFKLGEGYGSSIKMAEFRAAEDALRRLYLVQNDSLVLPSSTLELDSGGVGVASTASQTSTHYVPPPLGHSEVAPESAGKRPKGFGLVPGLGAAAS